MSELESVALTHDSLESTPIVGEQSEALTVVSSTSMQVDEVNGDESMVIEESTNGCDSTTEVNESLLDGDTPHEPATNEPNKEKTEISQIEESCSPKVDDGETKTSECSDENETATPNKTSRELKSILALSKEAKLDTNISTNRRKTLDISKANKTSTPKHSLKITNFPVTAESELDSLSEKSEKKSASSKKGKNYLTGSAAEGAANKESRRSLQGFSGGFAMLKQPNKDIFCWRCHHDSVQIACETCPRAYHLKCLKQTIVDMEHWPCPECVSILKAENTKTRSKAMKGMTLEHLCNLLKYAVKRMIQCSGSEPFVHPVDEKQFPEYRNYIIQPMTLTMLEKNIKDNLYGSTTAFESDAKWILHNSIIFNSYQSKLTTAAKTILKICKQEMAEIENCSSCYLNANTKKNSWFVEVCPKPHLLVWAKLKGFPYWPAKVMSINASGMADVRFFGAHDKAWVNCKDCFLYSVKDPNSSKQKRNDIIECVRELELYVENLKKIYGRVNFAPFKTLLDPEAQGQQLRMFLPSYKREGFDANKSKNTDNNDVEFVEAVESKKPEVGVENGEVSKKNDVISIKKVSEMPGTRMDLNNLQQGKAKLTARPIKAILVRKRHSIDNVPSENKMKFQQKETNSVRNSLDAEKIDKAKEKISPNSKLKITDQLIKKLEHEDSDEKMVTIDLDKKKETDTKSNDNEPLTNCEKKELPKKETAKSIGNVTVDSDEGSQDGKEISVELDPANICNIIHSSLVTPNKKSVVEVTKKRKLVESVEKEDESIFPPNKMVKLVPIENILQKKIDDEPPPPPPPQPPSEAKKTDNNNTSSNNTDLPVQIKNEIQSEDDEESENNDLQYMEAKRKYLSALNISEKLKVPAKPKAHEIRTRSKTEEKKIKKNSMATKTSEESVPKNDGVKEIYIKSLSKMQTPKHKARKSFPMPNYFKQKVVQARKLVPKSAVEDDVRLVNTAAITTSSANVMILPKLHYTKQPPPLRDINSPPVLTLLPRAPPETPKKVIEGSQNYIPQGEGDSAKVTKTVPIIDVDGPINLDAELGNLKEILPETVTKSVNEILCQPPPKLKPRPSTLLNSAVDAGVPSTAGPVSSRINAMAQKLGDYFRGLLVETINDLGKSNNPEATITSLKLSNEEMVHKHAIELAEIRRNVSIVLKDIQKSVVEERERITNELKSNYEIEMNKKVEEAKSKQWCANCTKEAQFYCCWNTSYCDYPCQQKHWLKHMSKCTQTANQGQASTAPRPQGQQLVLTPTAPPKFGTLFAKPQKVYLKRSTNTTPFKQTTTTTGAGPHITLVEAAPGNFEIMGNGPITVNGKILASTSVLEKIKSGNIVTVTAPSNTTSATQKVKTVVAATSKNNTSLSNSEY